MDDSAEGDAAFSAFFAESLPRFLGLARLLTGDRQRAEDLTQETFWRVHRAWSQIRDPEAAPAYARTVMIRLAIRWRGRRWSGEQPTHNDRLDGLGGGRVDADLAMVDELDALDRALASLPMQQRVVLVLRYFDERSEAEIAQLLHCSRGTVKSRAARGLAALRASGLVVSDEAAMAAPIDPTDVPPNTPAPASLPSTASVPEPRPGGSDA
jgi:RNA polymerase sigma-70 factor (sigma-E family)